MRKQGGSENSRSVLEPTLPVDLSAQQQRRKIVEAMIASVAEKTYAGTTISDIVSRAAVSRTTFYKRFGDKRACFDAALEQVRERTVFTTHTPVAAGNDTYPADEIRHALGPLAASVGTDVEQIVRDLKRQSQFFCVGCESLLL